MNEQHDGKGRVLDELDTAVRYKKVTRKRIVAFLRARSLVAELPDPVVHAIVGLLCKEGLFTYVEGHFDLTKDPGATLRYPPEAAEIVHRAVLGHLKQDRPNWILAHFVVANVASGSGWRVSCGAQGTGNQLKNRIQEKADAKARVDRQRTVVEKMKWEKGERIASFGENARREATVIVNFVIKREQDALERIESAFQDKYSQSTTSQLCENPPLEIQRIIERLGRDRAAPVLKACQALLDIKEEWVRGSRLKSFGLPVTSVRAYFQRNLNGQGIKGQLTPEVAYERSRVIKYVTDHWNPRLTETQRSSRTTDQP